MNLNVNLENTQQCRICLKNGDINIWRCKVPLNREPEGNRNSFGMDDSTEKSFIEIMDIFSNSQDLMNLTEEFPLLCRQCLDDLKFCYIFYEKIKLATIQLQNLYQESLNQCIEEEHLIEALEENELNELTDTNLIETLEEESVVNFPQYEPVNAKDSAVSKHIPLDKNDSFIVTQFISETLDTTEKCISETKNSDVGEFRPSQHWFTVNLKAVEVNDLDNLDSLQPSSSDITEPSIYVCQYCPQAFTKSDYLKTHIQKSHVCKFCTQPFIMTEELFSHIREVHTEHKCAICHKLLSSATNLRHHIKRVHRIKLPPKVTLIDFIKSSSLVDARENEMEILQELDSADIDFKENYMWKNDDCIEILNADNSSEIN